MARAFDQSLQRSLENASAGVMKNPCLPSSRRQEAERVHDKEVKTSRKNRLFKSWVQAGLRTEHLPRSQPGDCLQNGAPDELPRRRFGIRRPSRHRRHGRLCLERIICKPAPLPPRHARGRSLLRRPDLATDVSNLRHESTISSKPDLRLPTPGRVLTRAAPELKPLGSSFQTGR